jgi:SWIM zinc finger
LFNYSRNSILRHIYDVSPERLQKAVCGLADGTFHVYLTQQDNEHVCGSVINVDGKEYAVSIGDGYLSCACPDFGYRNATCKHLLAMALRILQTEEGVVEGEPEERPVNLKLGRARTSDELARDRAPRRLPALPYDELPD